MSTQAVPSVRLADFILSDMEAIVASWEAFARTLPAAGGMEASALRDHAEPILQAIAADLKTAQTPQQQRDKSHGLAQPLNAYETAAQTHAVLRARSGFDIKQLAAEYRALRTSVLTLWFERSPSRAVTDFDDVIRFNEAIDQALAESVDFFSFKVDQSRNLMLGMLGHDLRSPLQAIQLTAKLLAALNAGEKVSRAADRLITSGARMQQLVDDLLDFNRLQLGLRMRITTAASELEAIARQEIQELRAAYPQREVELQCQGETLGAWDVKRVQQLLSNLVVNALTHGTPDTAVKVMLTSDPKEVRIKVTNHGLVIDPVLLSEILRPLQRGALEAELAANDGLGLGLFIASEVAKGHGGHIEVESSGTETVFTAVLPRSV
jgi:signal transduction histidine kinase